jgi:hypothetical protein
MNYLSLQLANTAWELGLDFLLIDVDLGPASDLGPGLAVLRVEFCSQ